MARRTREDWVDAAVASILIDVQGAITIDALCDALGVTKGSFYHHFEDRSELVMEVGKRRDAVLDEIAASTRHISDPQLRFRAYCVEAFSSRENLHLEAFVERERVQNREVDKALQQADEAAKELQLSFVRDMGYSFEDAPRFLRILKAAAMGLVLLMMHEGVMLPLEERIEFANTLADLAVAGADCP